MKLIYIMMELDELVIGTIFLTMFYFIAGINKLRHFKSSTKSFAKKLPIASLFSGLIIALVIAIEILAPIAMVYAAFSPSHEIYGFTGSIILVGFTILATLLYHFPPTKKEHQMPFMRNLALIGGFLLYNASL